MFLLMAVTCFSQNNSNSDQKKLFDISVKVDNDCLIFIDGINYGIQSPGYPLTVPLMEGKHLICARTKDKKTLLIKKCIKFYSTDSKNFSLHISGPASESENIEPEMVYVKGGAFKMGSLPGVEKVYCWHTHWVKLRSYSIGKYEITQKQWQQVMGNNPSSGPKCDDCPVENISYFDVMNFIDALNFRTGNKYRLPTEAEWEYAARGGKKSLGYIYSGSNNFYEVGWWSILNFQFPSPHPVGTKKPNELGIYDMSGNVGEWCSDWFRTNYYYFSPIYNPKGPRWSDRWYATRVVRGDTQKNSYHEGNMVISRFRRNPDDIGSIFIGFRLVLPAEENKN